MMIQKMINQERQEINLKNVHEQSNTFSGANAKSELIRSSDKCPICDPNNRGILCDKHEILIHDFDMLRNYINNLTTLDDNALYIVSSAIANRVSYVISSHTYNPSHKRIPRVPIVNGRLMIEEYLRKNIDECLENNKKVKCSVYMERILTEIRILRKAKGVIIKIINEKRTGQKV